MKTAFMLAGLLALVAAQAPKGKMPAKGPPSMGPPSGGDGECTMLSLHVMGNF